MTPCCLPLLFFTLGLLFISQVVGQAALSKRYGGKICNVLDYGATEGTRDQGADVGPAIMRAYSQCVQKSSESATLLIPGGKSFRLMSRVLLDKAHNMILQWDGDIHLNLMFKVSGFNLNGAMIQFMHCNNVKLLGKGTFFGYGVLYRQQAKVGNDVPMEKRPRMIMFYKASNIEIGGGLILNDSPSYHLSAAGNNMHIHDLQIFQPLPTHGMTDGVSLSCDNCLVERVHVQNGDDCVVFKSPSSNSLVRGVKCIAGGGVGLGTVGHKGVWAMSNITFDNIEMVGSFGASIKSYPDSTGKVSDITFNNIAFQDVNYAIFAQQFFLKDTSQPLPMTWENIKYVNFTGTTTELVKAPILIHCSSASSCKDFHIEDFKVKQAGIRKTANMIQNVCGSGPGLMACSNRKRTPLSSLHRKKHFDLYKL